MKGTSAYPPSVRRWKIALVGLTLATSAVHFVDNALRLDLYPGPVWLTRNVILAAWVVVLAAGCLACWIDTRTALVAYAVLGFAGFAHCWMPHTQGLGVSCMMTIDAEAAASLLLITYALVRRASNVARPGDQ